MFDNIKHSLALDFHENSKSSIMINAYESNVAYKVYPNARAIPLVKNDLNANLKSEDRFLNTIFARKSSRNFSSAGITMDVLSKLLSLSCGQFINSDDLQVRTYASAGARYPIEVYAVVLRADDLDKGIYHYNIADNTLEHIKKGDYAKDVRGFYRNQHEHLDLNFPCLIVFSVIFDRSMDKYGEKGYRFALMDSGHMSQNFYLVAEYLNLGVVALGAGAESDDKLDEILSLVSSEENAFYSLAVGHPAT